MSPRRPARIFLALLLAMCVFVVLHVWIGTHASLSPSVILGELFRGPSDSGDATNTIVWQLRLPRVLLCLLVGGLLGAVGSSFQALFRNPLADPYVVGVSGGAAVGGSIAVLLGVGTALGGLSLSAFGFVGGMISLVVVYGLSRRHGVVDIRTLLLAGVVTGSFTSSMLSVVLLSAQKDTTEILRWLLGDTSNGSWMKIAVLAVVLAIGLVVLLRESRRLNALAMGGDVAQRLGVNVPGLTRVILLTGSAMTAVAVGTVGMIGFLGLVAPHLARKMVGVDWRWSLIGSTLIGALLLVVADSIAQRGLSYLTHTPGMEVPVGIVTSVIGAPVLLAMLKKGG